MPRPGRLPTLVQAALLVFTLVLAPEIHRHTCSGVCATASRSALAAGEETASAPAAATGAGEGHSCCHGGAAPDAVKAKTTPGTPESTGGPRGTSPGGCTCLDDCCTLYAHGTTPEVVTDTGPAVLLVSPPHTVDPSRRIEAPRARLLPYPNGPPAAA